MKKVIIPILTTNSHFTIQFFDQIFDIVTIEEDEQTLIPFKGCHLLPVQIENEDIVKKQPPIICEFDSFFEIEELIQKIQFYYYRIKENESEKSYYFKGKTLILLDHDRREWHFFTSKEGQKNYFSLKNLKNKNLNFLS